MNFDFMGSPGRKKGESIELFNRSYSPLYLNAGGTGAGATTSYSDTPLSPPPFSLGATEAASGSNSKYQYKSPPPFARTTSKRPGSVVHFSPPLLTSPIISSPRSPSSGDVGGRGGNFFLPPPAVTSFAYAQSKSLYDTQRSPLLSLQQEAKALTAKLQDLLDAQSAGLSTAGGFSGPGDDYRTGHGSSPSATGLTNWDGGVGGASVTTAVFPKRKPVSLKAARTGILQAMQALADVKATEQRIYSAEEAQRMRNVKQVEEWEQKRSQLEEEERELMEGEDVKTSIKLKKEKEAVELEIRQQEEHLKALKLHHARLGSRISTLDSTLNSRTGSCKAALSSLTSQQKQFFSSLPSNLRKHNVALENWGLEAQALREKQKQAQSEHEALREGIVEWKSTLAVVKGFEEKLQKALQQFSTSVSAQPTQKTRRFDIRGPSNNTNSFPDNKSFSSPSTFLDRGTSRRYQQSRELQSLDALIPHSEDEDAGGDGKDQDLFGVSSDSKSHQKRRTGLSGDDETHGNIEPGQDSLNRHILREVETVIERLERKLRLAESKNWKLLVCCIAAELQAFYEAREVVLKRLEQEGIRTASPPSLRSNTVIGSGSGSDSSKKQSLRGKRNTGSSPLRNSGPVNRAQGTPRAYSTDDNAGTRKSFNTPMRQHSEDNVGWGIDDIEFKEEHEMMPTTDEESISPKSPKVSRKGSLRSNRGGAHSDSIVGLGGDASNDGDRMRERESKGNSLTTPDRPIWGRDNDASDDENEGSGTVRGSTFLRGPSIIGGRGDVGDEVWNGERRLGGLEESLMLG